jgi:signal transduction histidine kinase
VISTFAPIRLLLIDDDADGGASVREVLSACDLRRVDLASETTLAGAFAAVEAGAVDIVLLAASMSGAHGDDLVPRLLAVAPMLPIVVLAKMGEAAMVERLLGQGAQDYLLRDGLTAGMVVRVIDHVTSRMRLLREQEARLAELRVAIETKNRALGVLAHDLRSPMNVIVGYIQMLELEKAECIKGNASRYVDHIKEAAGFATALIENVLSIAVHEADEVRITLREVDFTDLTERVVRSNALLARGKGVDVIIDPPGRASIIGRADSLKMEQLLGNLVGNAVKFSYPGRKVRVGVRHEEAVIALSVVDEGEGIPPEIRSRLFRPFCKGASGTAGEPTNGLGLYICARIAEAHGGWIDVDSRPGQGTAMTLYLPAACADGRSGGVTETVLVSA